MNILVLLPVNDRHRAILESSAPGEDFIYTSSDAATREQVADADVILGNIDPSMLTACEHLQLLQLQTAGYDDYLAAGTVPADAKLSCSVGAYGQAVSEHMFAMVLSMMKRLPGYHDLQREHRWEDLGPVTSLKNANVLVLGAGDIGGHFATLWMPSGSLRSPMSAMSRETVACVQSKPMARSSSTKTRCVRTSLLRTISLMASWRPLRFLAIQNLTPKDGGDNHLVIE